VSASCSNRGIGRHLLDADQAAEIAVESVNAPAGDSFLKGAEQRVDKLSTPPAHRDRLRDEAVSEWERQHPEHR
jgi:hypothetical protein